MELAALAKRYGDFYAPSFAVRLGRNDLMRDLLVTVNQVDVTPDLKNAHVYISVLGSKGRGEVLPKLEANRAALQADLARHVVLKYTPHLVFHLDDSIERGSRVLEILQEIEPSPATEPNE